MRRFPALVFFMLAIGGCLCLFDHPAHSQAQATDQDRPLYLDPGAPLEARVNDLVSRMTLEEEISELQNASPAIPRLGVPSYNWWSEGLHGVARAGIATVFPQAIGLAATWDTDMVHRAADVISTEARAKYNDAIQQGNTGRYFGLTFWSPNINIVRDPRWGRGQETYGEDPFLTGRMAVAFVSGLQGNNPQYLKTVATPKHFAVHSGPEAWRDSFDARPSAHDLEDTYTPAFRAAIVEGRAGSVMCAYSAVDGVPDCANEQLFSVLRKQWNFGGYVVSDCGAIGDIYRGHGYVLSLPQAAALALRAGTDLSCGTEFAALRFALENRLVTREDIERSVKRLFRARFRLGMFDPPERVPWSHLTLADNDTPEHRQMALDAARESIVLLKNDAHTLPLDPGIRTIAVVGPNADSLDVLLGEYNGTPSHYSTILGGIRRRFPRARVLYSAGSVPVATVGVPVSESFLRTGDADCRAGLSGEYFANTSLEGARTVRRVDQKIDFDWSGVAPAPEIPMGHYSVRWTGELVPSATGDYRFSVRSESNSGVRFYLDGSCLIDEWKKQGDAGLRSLVHLVGGHVYAVRLEYAHRGGDSSVHLLWEAPDFLERAVAAARESDVVVAVVGLTAQLEGEESDVALPGFFGGDRVDLDLPSPQEQLLKAVAATGKPLIVVLTSGSALAVNWAEDHAAAIMEVWYPGEEGGTAVADALSGAYNPAGRLPITFYKSVEPLPPFTSYSMAGRTYRYFAEQPLYPFGYGLSYTTFRYDNPEVSQAQVSADGSVSVSVRVTNTGERAGDEVVQLYLTHSGVDGAPLRALAGFERIHLEPGASRTVSFPLHGRELSVVDADGIRRVVPGDVQVWVGGGQPVAGSGQAPSAGIETKFRITSAASLPE